MVGGYSRKAGTVLIKILFPAFFRRMVADLDTHRPGQQIAQGAGQVSLPRIRPGALHDYHFHLTRPCRLRSRFPHLERPAKVIPVCPGSTIPSPRLRLSLTLPLGLLPLGCGTRSKPQKTGLFAQTVLDLRVAHRSFES
jgi:hypothetical protein